jgi:hypothetical protein
MNNILMSILMAYYDDVGMLIIVVVFAFVVVLALMASVVRIFIINQLKYFEIFFSCSYSLCLNTSSVNLDNLLAFLSDPTEELRPDSFNDLSF